MQSAVGGPGGSVAVDVIDEDNRDVWIIDLERKTPTRLTFNSAGDGYPAWTPDSSRVVWSLGTSTNRNLFWQNADGTGTPEQLTNSVNDQLASWVTPDGESLLFTEANPETGSYDIGMLSLVGDSQPELLLATPYQEGGAVVSPNGRWLAYQTDESGQFEIVARPFTDINAGRWQLSRDGGTW